MTSSAHMHPRDRLMVALDTPDTRAAEGLVSALSGRVGVFKIGLELAMNGGIDFARDLAVDGHKIFLDMKLHDIANTVSKAVENAAEQRFAFLTVHAYPATMKAAVAGAQGSGLCLLGVTVLTSFNQQDLADAGYSDTPETLVLSRAKWAADLGMGGIVCSAQEVSAVRGKTGDALRIVTPGIRPSGSDSGDQKRVATPASAISSGSNFLVVGRPITQAADPAAAAEAIVDEIASA